MQKGRARVSNTSAETLARHNSAWREGAVGVSRYGPYMRLRSDTGIVLLTVCLVVSSPPSCSVHEVLSVLTNDSVHQLPWTLCSICYVSSVFQRPMAEYCRFGLRYIVHRTSFRWVELAGKASATRRHPRRPAAYQNGGGF